MPSESDVEIASSTPSAPASHRYDAFVSYAHAADGTLALALRLGLERLTKPWYRRRALNVYLDSAGMGVTPALWGTISEVLADTGHLVVLCSPEAAASEWVDREVRWWLEHRHADTILLVVTAGTWEWDAVHARIATHSSAVPPALFTAFREEPRHLDLRGPRARYTARPAGRRVPRRRRPAHRGDHGPVEGRDPGGGRPAAPRDGALQPRISADGARLIGGRSDGGVVVVDLASGAEIARLTGLSKNVTAVALSSDGRLAAAGDFAGTGFRTAVI